MNKFVFFNQASLDVSEICKIIQKNRIPEDNITIYSIGVENNCKYLKTILKKSEIIFIPKYKLTDIRIIITILKIIFNYCRIMKKYGYTVYYFSNLDDIVTSTLIDKIKKNNDVVYINVYNDNYNNRIKEYPMRNSEIFLNNVVNYIFGIDQRFVLIDGNRHYLNNQSGITEKRILKTNININFLYTPEITGDAVLFYECNLQEQHDYKNNVIFKNYEEILMDIIQQLIKKFSVYIKPHPRLGYSKILNKYAELNFIPEYIPAEFINYEVFTKIYGVETLALGNTSLVHNETYSLIELMDLDGSIKKGFVDRLNTISSNRLNYIHEYEDL